MIGIGKEVDFLEHLLDFHVQFLKTNEKM